MLIPSGGSGMPIASTVVSRHFTVSTWPSKSDQMPRRLCRLAGRLNHVQVPAGQMPKAPLSMLRASSSQKTDFRLGAGLTT